MMNENLIKNYLLYCKVERGLSENTLIAYRTHFNTFNKYNNKNFKYITLYDMRMILNNIYNNDIFN